MLQDHSRAARFDWLDKHFTGSHSPHTQHDANLLAFHRNRSLDELLDTSFILKEVVSIQIDSMDGIA